MLRRLLIATSLLVPALPAGAASGPGIALDRTSALPNERVTVTSARPVPLRLYLVRADAAGKVTSRRDSRLTFVGLVQGRRSLSFSVPPLDARTYRLAAWDGRRLTMTGARLRVRAASGCPVTLPNGNRPPGQPRSVPWYGNGLLWAGVEVDGIFRPTQSNADGSFGNKLLWVTTPPAAKPTITGRRIDAPAPPLRVLQVNTGSFSGAASPSHMTPVGFPSVGCWRLRARLGDVSLVYVVQVVAGPQD
jgi:hypothetical protein